MKIIFANKLIEVNSSSLTKLLIKKTFINQLSKNTMINLIDSLFNRNTDYIIYQLCYPCSQIDLYDVKDIPYSILCLHKILILLVRNEKNYRVNKLMIRKTTLTNLLRLVNLDVFLDECLSYQQIKVDNYQDIIISFIEITCEITHDLN